MKTMTGFRDSVSIGCKIGTTFALTKYRRDTEKDITYQGCRAGAKILFWNWILRILVPDPKLEFCVEKMTFAPLWRSKDGSFLIGSRVSRTFFNFSQRINFNFLNFDHCLPRVQLWLPVPKIGKREHRLRAKVSIKIWELGTKRCPPVLHISIDMCIDFHVFSCYIKM